MSPHDPTSRRHGAHTWLVCEGCGIGYNPVLWARSTGRRLRPGDPDPDRSWNRGDVDRACGAPLRCACRAARLAPAAVLPAPEGEP